jgi:hypothetical protein
MYKLFMIQNASLQVCSLSNPGSDRSLTRLSVLQETEIDVRNASGDPSIDQDSLRSLL